MLASYQVVMFVDDFLVGGKTQEEQNKNLSEVLSKLREAGMHENKRKIQPRRNHVLFLGYNVSGGAFSLNSYLKTQNKRLPLV